MNGVAACDRVEGPQADLTPADLHHLAGLPAERVRHRPESERTRKAGAKRLIGLLELLDLMGDNLDELLELLQLRRNEVDQLLEQRGLLLLKELNLLKLLRHDLQQLQDLLRGRLRTKRLTYVRREAPGILRPRIDRRRADSIRGTCELTHVTSSVTVDSPFFIRQPEHCRVLTFALTLRAERVNAASPDASADAFE